MNPNASSHLTALPPTAPLPVERRQRCEVWTRVMGYHRPVSQFNLGKRAEHRERLHFAEPVDER